METLGGHWGDGELLGWSIVGLKKQRYWRWYCSEEQHTGINIFVRYGDIRIREYKGLCQCKNKNLMEQVGAGNSATEEKHGRNMKEQIFFLLCFRQSFFAMNKLLSNKTNFTSVHEI